jgi:hypothetical protein
MEPTKNVKEITLLAHGFDCLPGHVTLTGRGRGSSLRVAAMRAMENLFKSPELKRKRLTDCKLSLVVTK